MGITYQAIQVSTRIVSPHGLDVATWHSIVNNNDDIKEAFFIVESDEEWLSTILSEVGFFPSNSQVRKNRPDLWRAREEYETVSLKWATIVVCPTV